MRMLCMYCAYTAHVYHVCGAKPTKGVSTIDKVRVNGWLKILIPLVLIVKIYFNQLVSFFVLCLRNNLLFLFSGVSQLSQQFVKMLSGKHNAGYAVKDCVVAFLKFWLFAFTLRRLDLACLLLLWPDDKQA